MDKAAPQGSFSNLLARNRTYAISCRQQAGWGTAMRAMSRRSAMTGLASVAAAATVPGFAAAAESPVAQGILTNNPLAQAFEKAPASFLPNVDVLCLDGVKPIAELIKGRTVLMPLWAEWCAPCLSEIPDFAKLQRKYGRPSFAVLPILTSTFKQFSLEAVGQMFNILHAPGLEPMIENHFGRTLFTVMARQGNKFALPCNLLIGPDGRVVGREIGRVTSDNAATGDAPQANGDPETVRRAEAGQTQSVWGEEAGEKFAAAMAAGFLE
jgi:thiol-disulfide isomerase/thioredoxin